MHSTNFAGLNVVVAVVGNGCGSVGRAVRGSNLVVSKNFIEHLLTVNCIEKTNIKKEAGNGPFLKTLLLLLLLLLLLWLYGWFPLKNIAYINPCV